MSLRQKPKKNRDQVRDSLSAKIRLTPKTEDKPIDSNWYVTWTNRRLKAAVILIFALFGVAWLRAFQLAFHPDGRMRGLGKAQYQSLISLTPHRGAIYDRSLRELAVSIYVDSLYARPKEIKAPDRVARQLAGILKTPYRELVGKLSSKKNFVWLKRWCEPAMVQKIELLNVEGLDFIKESKRYYPNRQLAAHLIGFVGLDAQGLEGVELKYDEFLRRPEKKLLVDRDGLGQNLLRESPGRDTGWNVVLTIDSRLQNAVQNALAERVEKHSAQAGIVVVMDPMSGEILALANHPAFNPNRFVDESMTAFRNRAVTDMFEPGSLVKVLLAAAAFETHKLSPRDPVYCEEGKFRVGKNIIREANSRKYGWLPFRDVLRFSSNIGAAKAAFQVGREPFYRILKGFGFGRPTGVDLPGEAEGMLRDWQKWREIDLATIAFGQGVSATPLQLVTALSEIANGGILVVPHVLKYRVREKETVPYGNRPEIQVPVLSQATVKQLKAVMKAVVEEKATGWQAVVPGVEVAGKTGTAQKVVADENGIMRYSDTKLVVSFFGFFPVENPRLAILVMIDEPKLPAAGGTVAAPLFKEIATAAIQFGYLNDAEAKVASRRPQGKRLAEGEPVSVETIFDQEMTREAHDRVVEEMNGILKSGGYEKVDFRGLSLQTALMLANAHRIPVVVAGRGYVTSQEIRKKENGDLREIVLHLEPRSIAE